METKPKDKRKENQNRLTVGSMPHAHETASATLPSGMSLAIMNDDLDNTKCPNCKTCNLRTQISYTGLIGKRKKIIRVFCLICKFENSHIFDISQEDFMREVRDKNG